MSVTYGFYNSKNKDRTYDAIQMSSIFDGIIRDGILQHVGDTMMVKESSGMTVHVGTGRAWFNHTWTLNDSILPLEVPESDLILKRIDAVVLEVDARESERKNSIKIVKGTPASVPVKPSMIKTTDRWQYPLAYIQLDPGVTAIRQANNTNTIGTSECPFVTAPLEKMSVDDLLAQWRDQWEKFYSDETNYVEAANLQWQQNYSSWYNTFTTEMLEWRSEAKEGFYEWISQIQDIISEDVASNLANRILELEKDTKELQQSVDELDFSEIDTIDTLAKKNKFLVRTDDGNKSIEAENLIFAAFDTFASVEIRRSIFRGKNLGSSFTDQQSKEIRKGNFQGFFVGDYWEINGFKWRIVDIDYWYKEGANFVLTNAHHLVIMPDSGLYRAQMNSRASTDGGYFGSEMYTKNINEAKRLINLAFGENHIIEHVETLSSAVVDGRPSEWKEVEVSTVELPTEIMTRGYFSREVCDGKNWENKSPINRQLALFRISNQFTYTDIAGFWLRDVISRQHFAVFDSNAHYSSAHNQCGVRPVFMIR